MPSLENSPDFSDKDLESLRLFGICHELLRNKIPSLLEDADQITNEITRQIANNSNLVNKYHIPIYKSYDALTDNIPSIRLRLVPKELYKPITIPDGEITQIIINIPEAFIDDTQSKEGISLATIKIFYESRGQKIPKQYILTTEDMYEYTDFSLLDFLVSSEKNGEETVRVDSSQSHGLSEHTVTEKLTIAENILNGVDSYVIGTQSRQDNTM